MKYEFSAGGIVYKRGRTRKEKDTQKNAEKILILVARHSMHHGWVFPKGLIGDTKENKNQTKEETAIREVREETGIDAKIENKIEPVQYWYVWKGDPSTGSGRGKIKKTVYYFVMRFTRGNIEDHDEEMEEVEWIDYNEVQNRLTYPSDKKAWREAQKFFTKIP